MIGPRDAYGNERTPYAVQCQGMGQCGKVYLSALEYEAQMDRPDYGWRCPICRDDAAWDDDNYEAYYEEATS